MKIHYLKLKHWLLCTALGILGLTACQTQKKAATQPAGDEPQVDQPTPRPGGGAVMYGVPTMNFTLQGRVLNAEGQPVQGVQVVLVNQNIDIEPGRMEEQNPYVQEYLQHSADTTNAGGEFKVTARDMPVNVQRVIVRDIDGAENGSYEDQMFEVSFDDARQTREGNGWDRGDKSKEITVTLNNK